jgi:hypothetical protein
MAFENSNEPGILKQGRMLCFDLHLEKARREFTHPFATQPNSDDNTAFLEFVITLLAKFEITEYNVDNIRIIHKNIPEMGLKWHIDDCVITKHKTPPTYNLDQYIHLDGIKYLYFNTPTNRLPRFTLLFYYSTYDIDFTGGELCLSDGFCLKPCAGMGFIMDSREVHMVNPIKSGVRTVSIVKIY